MNENLKETLETLGLNPSEQTIAQILDAVKRDKKAVFVENKTLKIKELIEHYRRKFFYKLTPKFKDLGPDPYEVTTEELFSMIKEMDEINEHYTYKKSGGNVSSVSTLSGIYQLELT